MESQQVTIQGIVTGWNRPQNRGDPTTYSIKGLESGRTYTVSTDFFCPIRINDYIVGYGLYDGKVIKLSCTPAVEMPCDREAICKYLAGITKTRDGYEIGLYRRVYDRLMSNHCFESERDIEKYISQLAQQWSDTRDQKLLRSFDGVNEEKTRKIFVRWHKERSLRKLYLLDINNEEIKACKLPTDRMYEKCVINPYTLAAIPIEKAVKIVDRFKIDLDAIDRLRGEIVRVLYRNLTERKWVGTPLVFLGRQFPNLAEQLPVLQADYGVVVDMNLCYLEIPHEVETQVSNYIAKLRLKDHITYDTPIDTPMDTQSSDSTEVTVKRCPAVFSVEVSEDQRMAIQGALDHTVSIITGPAGTGKTRCLGQIVHNLELRGVKYAVCSFTGKAVARIREVTKNHDHAQTIHRLILNSGETEYEHIIIDEASMLTTELFDEFVTAYPNTRKVTFIGDVNQLSPITWGSLFKEVVRSHTIPTYRLTTNFRVYQDSGKRDYIIMNSNALVTYDGSYPFDLATGDNFSVVVGGIDQVYTIIEGCCRGGIKMENLVVLCPYNKWLPQIDAKFQAVYDKGRAHVWNNNIKWMEGDRVMMMENNQYWKVFNGETGIVTRVESTKIHVDFGNDRAVTFLLQEKKYVPVSTNIEDGDDPDYDRDLTVLKLKHAYALTVDKSQGSEWDFVILFVPDAFASSFIDRNRIYTSITRAKRMVWCVTPDTDVLSSMAVKSSRHRYENLAPRLGAVLEEIPEFKLINRESPLDADLEMASYMPEDMGIDPDDY
jgi:hypothetical protein